MLNPGDTGGRSSVTSHDKVVLRTGLAQDHAELMTAEWWKKVKEDILSGNQADVFPYPKNRRFKYRYG